MARMVHRDHRGRRRHAAGEACTDLSGAEGLVSSGTLLRLPLHQCGRRTRQGPEASSRDRDAAQEGRPRLHRKLAAEMGSSDPEMLAHQLALLMDGAIVAAMVSRDPGVADAAGLAACSLFAPAKSRKPKRAGNASEQLLAM